MTAAFLNPKTGRISHLQQGTAKYDRAVTEEWKKLSSADIRRIRQEYKAAKGLSGDTVAKSPTQLKKQLEKKPVVVTATEPRVGVTAEPVQDLMADLADLKKDADKLQSQIGVTKKQQTELKQTIKEIEATRDKLRGKRQELKDIRETAAKIEKIRDELTETKPMYRVGGTDRQAVVLKAAVKVREKVIKPVLDSLQGIIEHFESKSGYTSVEEINNYITTTPGGRLGGKFRPKTVDEAINRLAFAFTGGVKGGVKELTLPLSWGLSPPTTEAQRSAEFLGAVVTPSPLDYVVVKTFSKLYSTGKKGKDIISKLVRGSSLTDEEISILEKTWEIDKKLSQGKQYSLEDLLNIGKKKDQNKLDALYEKAGQFFKKVDADEAGKAAKKLDETLSVASIDGDWSEGINLKTFYEPDKQREGLKFFKDQIKKQSDILDGLFDLDPEKLVEWNTLPAKQKTELMELVKKWQKVWADNPDIYHMTAGGSRQTLLQTQIDELLDAAGMSELDFLKAHSGDFTTLSPAALIALLERLNKTTDGEIVASDVDEDLLRDAKEGYLVLQDLTDIVDETIDEETGIIEDVDIVEDEEDEKVKPTPDQKLEDTQDQVEEEEEEETTIPIPEEILTEEEEPTPTFLPKSSPEEKRDIRLRLWGGPKEKYRVKFSYPRGQSQTVTVEARSYPEAVNRAQRSRRGNKYLPSVVDVVRA